MKKLLFTSLAGYLIYLLFVTSCANPGVPTGGDKDTIPPVVIRTVPEAGSNMYNGNTVSLTFDEFIISNEIIPNLVISPPIQNRPTLRTRSKTLIIDFGDNLKPGTTYSLDFKDAIKDNNEENPLEDYRFSFSTGANFDTLAIGGYVRNAENMEPMEGILVVLHSDTSLNAFREDTPDYIAKTDEDGLFIITNIAAGTYKLYAIDDGDNSLTFNQPSEMIAFSDSVIPLRNNSTGEEMKPNYLLLFQEDFFNQYLESYTRDQPNLCQFYFAESLSDSFQISLLSPEATTPDWSYTEYNSERDSVSFWIKDEDIYSTDTLKFQLSYQIQDSLENFIINKDTLSLYYSFPEEVRETRPFTFLTNVKDNFDINAKLRIRAPEPLSEFDLSAVHLRQVVGTEIEDIGIDIIQDSISPYKYSISNQWEPEGNYQLQIDSAAAVTILNQPSDILYREFTIQKENYYAKIILNIFNLPGNCIVQLLEDTEEENLVLEKNTDSDGEIEFDYLKPNRYRIRLIVDRNNNGKWDTGNLNENIQPERVIYFPKILRLRSNFDTVESWNLPDELQFTKDLTEEN